MTDPGVAIRLSELYACAECRVAFRGGQSCPKCAAISGLYPVETEEPSKEIGRLRDQLVWITAQLLTIAKGSHTAYEKARMAQRALDYIKASDAAASIPGEETRRERVS